MKYKYTEDQVLKAVASSFSIRETLEKLGVVPAGGNYKVFRKLIKKFNLDVSHFKGQSWNKGRVFGPKRPLEDYLSNAYPCQTSRLRIRLLKEKILYPKCYSCGLEQWLGAPIPLELEHKNGNSNDNSLNNLTLLCPNCHALTPTYRGKNKGNYKS